MRQHTQLGQHYMNDVHVCKLHFRSYMEVYCGDSITQVGYYTSTLSISTLSAMIR